MCAVVFMYGVYYVRVSGWFSNSISGFIFELSENEEIEYSEKLAIFKVPEIIVFFF